MNAMKCVSILSLLAVLAVAESPADAGAHRARQYYSGWHKHSTHGYHYRHYYYKPHADFAGYKHHYVIYHPRHPDYFYFYNPYTKQYWGRCPVKNDGKPAYSLLAEKDRRGTLAEIPESAFPKPGALPPIPESTDGEPLDLPPDDLPAAEPAAK